LKEYILIALPLSGHFVLQSVYGTQTDTSSPDDLRQEQTYYWQLIMIVLLFKVFTLAQNKLTATAYARS
jgi:hypothetical protein